MKKDYKNDSKKLTEALGGKENIKKVFHCMTRLRFYLNDKSKIDKDSINSLSEVSGINWHNDQLQIIVGNDVNEMYKELLALGAPSDDNSSDIETNSKGIVSKVVDSITGCMTPMIPALTAAGMIKVVLTLLTTFNLVETTSSSYQVINFIGDVAFYFMPFLIAANAAKVFHVNQALALIIAGVFLHPNFTAMIASQDPISLFGLPITKFSYAYSVIPVILMVWIMSYIEKLVDKITPRIFKLILNPTLIMLISAPIALIVVGPLGGLIGDWLAVAINFLSTKLGFVIVGILGATFPFIVMTGMHHALTPIGLNAIATGGADKLIFVSQVCSNIAQSGASLAVAVKSKDKDMKQLASASGISALMGITEPALYGVTLKLKRPVIAASIAAGIGGIVGGILQVSLYIAQNSIMAIPAFIGEAGMGNLLAGVIMIIVSFVASFILTILFGFKDINPEEKKKKLNIDEDKIEEKPLVERIEIYSPIAGTFEKLSNVPDRTFSDKLVGDGVAIIPADGKVYAPADGTVISIMESKHGILFKTNTGVELLIHIGLDTMKLNGKYFKSHVSNGTEVNLGDLLLEFDINSLNKEGYNLITPIVVTNIDNYIKAVPMLSEKEEVKILDNILTIV
ncbi:beta-glucoside-specific PTS transporter subunit IIABC [uncultured Clostridium sp.]|uniref:beta-glucoside-specific PTS transporter subunit IIABC n=1 Tax=uncultured Clostridium sp. TaxID=59620 RepID=UPI000821F0C1|nr:beta-glucoside-specific PTS transporter subunit IIABC [uncultured Clostridium sp.]SCJ42692.1 EIIBCA-Bgl [uncultured Clostridium sp.]